MKPPRLGPTHDFPEGKLNPDDEGALTIGITVEGGNVIVMFGKATKWIGMPKENAIAFAKLILKRAEEL